MKVVPISYNGAENFQLPTDVIAEFQLDTNLKVRGDVQVRDIYLGVSAYVWFLHPWK